MKKRQTVKAFGMVDISAKAVTRRTAKATARILMGPKAFRALMTKGSPKGDVFETRKDRRNHGGQIDAASIIPIVSSFGIKSGDDRV